LRMVAMRFSMKSASWQVSGKMTLSRLELVRSRSCQVAMLSTMAWAFDLSSLERPQTVSLFQGLRLWGMALEPVWPAAKPSWTSKISVR